MDCWYSSLDRSYAKQCNAFTKKKVIKKGDKTSALCMISKVIRMQYVPVWKKNITNSVNEVFNRGGSSRKRKL